MKRDIDLVRKILFEMEKCDHGFSDGKIIIDGHSDEEIGYHIYLMNEAGLIYAIDSTTLDSQSPEAIPLRLTWAGHDFLDACRNEGRWQKAKKIIEEKVQGASFDIIKLVLTRIMESQVNLVFS